MERNLTIREEANAITCIAFRNSFLEDLHAGTHSDLLENDELSRITNEEMKKLMIQSSAKLSHLLELKEADPERYWKEINWFHDNYTKRWSKGASGTS